MILTTYMLADTIRNIQNGVKKRKKIHQNAVKKGNKKTKQKPAPPAREETEFAQETF